MKKVYLFMAVLFLVTTARAGYLVDVGGAAGKLSVTTLSCANFKTALNAWATSGWPGQTVGSCSSDPVTLTTTFVWVPSNAVGGIYGITLVCGSGTHLDTSTNTCVDDVTVALASCLPSIRTIAPCPSGFAPTNAMPTGSSGPTSYPSIFDNMSVQDVLVAGFYLGVFVLGMRNGRAKQP